MVKLYLKNFCTAAESQTMILSHSWTQQVEYDTSNTNAYIKYKCFK